MRAVTWCECATKTVDQIRAAARAPVAAAIARHAARSAARGGLRGDRRHGPDCAGRCRRADELGVCAKPLHPVERWLEIAVAVMAYLAIAALPY